jgi:hypothetical protein
MRALLILGMISLATACQRTPEQQQADNLQNEARQRGAAIESRADVEADRLQQQASDLENEANQAGGMTGERLRVRSDALNQESKLIRNQADMQADAIREGTDARIKASKSR